MDTALEVQGSRELSVFEQELAQMAEETAAVEKESGWPWVSIAGKKFTIQDVVQIAPMQAIIIDAAFEKTYYKAAYNPKSKDAAPPDCLAVGRVEEELAPPEGFENPQSASCDTCKWNEFGTAHAGNGKACGDSRRMLLMAPDEANLDDPTLIAIRVPVMSLKSWAKFVNRLKVKYRKPYFAAVVSIDFDQSVDYPKLDFSFVEEIQDEAKLRAILELRKINGQAFVTPFVRSKAANLDDSPSPEDEAPKKKKF